VNLTSAYLAAIQAIGRPKRELKTVYPQNWREDDKPCAALVLVGGWTFDFGDWPAIAMVFARGTYHLGHTISGSAFPQREGVPKLFEGSQCIFEVGGDDARIAKDVSTNGTVVMPPEAVRSAPVLRLDDALRAQWDSACPKAVRPHDVVLTQYAELVFVPLES
jgi:hypothetical protein